VALTDLGKQVADVFNGKVPASAFARKVVLVGVTAPIG
jgi:CHASE2 domain-containing sensor protein